MTYHGALKAQYMRNTNCKADISMNMQTKQKEKKRKSETTFERFRMH